jgi:hypothetical protein
MLALNAAIEAAGAEKRERLCGCRHEVKELAKQTLKRLKKSGSRSKPCSLIWRGAVKAVGTITEVIK